MGNLTDDMTRLSGEINALRSDRGALMQELSRGAKDLATSVAAMRAGFAGARATMAKEARDNRANFVSAMCTEVNTLLTGYRKERGEMALEGSESRAAFCAGVRKYVGRMCTATADDLAGARRAWRGQGRELHKTKPVPKPQKPAEPPPRQPQVPQVVARVAKMVKAPLPVAKSRPAAPAVPGVKNEKGREDWSAPAKSPKKSTRETPKTTHPKKRR